MIEQGLMIDDEHRWDAPAVPAGFGHTGQFTHSPWTVEYYTSQPAATQWVAVATVRVDQPEGDPVPRLVVGSGTTEEDALQNLAERINDLPTGCIH